MARHLVTGAAGFIGSQIAEALIDKGEEVVGVDCFTPYYDVAIKEGNVRRLMDETRFQLVRSDLRTADLRPLLDGVSCVLHQAGQPGVRLSWSDGFSEYNSCNVLSTQRLLEAARETDVRRFVYASSSSVYGNADRYPVQEQDLPKPHSPYGVTKLAGEHLCGLYAQNWGVPTIALRYFTVYGPRQRPDMAIHRLITCALTGEPFPLFGDGTQVRDFTYVGDVVDANLAAMTAECGAGQVLNVCAGGSTSMSELIEAVAQAVGAPVSLEHRDAQAGDVQRTGGANELAVSTLGWEPSTPIDIGIRQQVDSIERGLHR